MKPSFTKHSPSRITESAAVVQTPRASSGTAQKPNWLWPNDHGKLPRAWKCSATARGIAAGTLPGQAGGKSKPGPAQADVANI